MAKYLVCVADTSRYIYEVEADSEEAACEMVQDDDGELERTFDDGSWEIWHVQEQGAPDGLIQPA